MAFVLNGILDAVGGDSMPWMQRVQNFGSLKNLPPDLWAQMQKYGAGENSGGNPGGWNYGGYNIRPEISYGQGQDGAGNNTLGGYYVTPEGAPTGDAAAGQTYAQFNADGNYTGSDKFHKPGEGDGPWMAAFIAATAGLGYMSAAGMAADAAGGAAGAGAGVAGPGDAAWGMGLDSATGGSGAVGGGYAGAEAGAATGTIDAAQASTAVQTATSSGMSIQDAVSSVAQQLGVSPSSLVSLIKTGAGLLSTFGGTAANVGSGVLQAGAASKSAGQIEDGINKADSILSPAYRDAAKLQADAQNKGGATLAKGYTDSSNQIADADMLGASTLASGYGQAAGTEAAGITAGANTLAQGFDQAGQTESKGTLQGGKTIAAGYTDAAATEAAGAMQGARTLAGGYDLSGRQEVAGLERAQSAADRTLAGQFAIQQPYQAAGTRALNTLSEGLAPGGRFNTPFSDADMKNVMPAYTFARDQALEAMRNQMSAGGQALGANAAQGAGTLAAGLAGQFEQQAFNQWLAQNNLSLGALQHMVQTGQVSTTALQQALASAGMSTQQIQSAIGVAAGSATLGGAKAMSTGEQLAANYTGAGTLGAATATGQSQQQAAQQLGQSQLGAARARGDGQTNSARVLGAGILGGAQSMSAGQINAGRARGAGTLGASGTLANSGINAANATAGGLMGSAGADANAALAIANARAAGTVGRGNALNSAWGNAVNSLFGSKALNNARGNPSNNDPNSLGYGLENVSTGTDNSWGYDPYATTSVNPDLSSLYDNPAYDWSAGWSI